VAERRFEPAPARCEAMHAAVGLAIALALKASLLDSIIPNLDRSRSFRIASQALGGFAVVPGFDFGVSLSLQHSFAERLAARLSFAGSDRRARPAA
jgi:hypothetical protein